MSRRMMAGTARPGLATAGIALAIAAMTQASAAQGGDAPAVAPAPVTVGAAKAAAGNPEKGRELFANFSCGTCHSLADAGATSPVGPALDGNAALTHDFVAERIANGQGAMPGFSGQLSKEEIDDIAAYVMKAKK